MLTQFINGEWCEGKGPSLESRNPANDELLWRGKSADESAVDEALQAAKNAFVTWSLTPVDERLAVIRRYADILIERKEEMAKLISDETGKAIWDARGEAGAHPSDEEMRDRLRGLGC